MSDIIELKQASGVLTRSRVAAYIELTKPRIAGMVLVATALGFYLARTAEGGPKLHLPLPAVALLVHALLGTALVAAGANALNQFLEAGYDGRMVRTQDRPIPSGRLTAAEVLTFAVLISVVGVLYLSLCVNFLASLVALLALLSYVFLYTPLKRNTWLCLFVGAVAGALPPVIGWAAGAGTLTMGACLPFAILFFWQLPHFAVIAWLNREDYGRAGFPMLPVIDPKGTRTDRCVITQTLALLVASLLPAIYGLTGFVYAIGATVLGLAFLGCGVLFVCRKTNYTARFHLLASVIYLPLLFAVLILDKTPQP